MEKKTSNVLPFRNRIQLENKAKVSLSMEWENENRISFREGDSVVGYAFTDDGHYYKYYLGKSIDNIARFICSSDRDKMLCNVDDYAIACTLGKFLDVSIHSFKECIMENLVKYQRLNRNLEFDDFD